MFTGPMPSITPVQIKAALAFVASQAVAFGVLDTPRAQTLLSAGGTVVAVLWPIADAYLRGHRVHAVAENPAVAAVQTPVAPTTHTKAL